ncbi:Fc.00g109010.m01.CDS01 [Cosmosporella sp. VM-42]
MSTTHEDSTVRGENIAASSSEVPTVDRNEVTANDAVPDVAEGKERDGSLDRETSGEASETDSKVEEKTSATTNRAEDAPPLPNELLPDGPPLPKEDVPAIDADAPPLPNEPLPQPEDDGWDCQWDQTTGAWFFINRFTGKSQWDNPRIPTAPAAAPGTTQPSVPQPPVSETPAAGGYNPAIHGDYDPNAWYAKGTEEEDHAASRSASGGDPNQVYGVTATFNRFTGQFQTGDMGPERHSDEAKSKRQMNAFFDVDAAANAHDGRSLKAERSGKKPSKAELKTFKEKRRARKEEKRRAWLRD